MTPMARTVFVQESTPEPATLRATHGSILVVDHDRGARDTVVAMVSRPGITVRTASTGAEALALAPRVQVDLVLCELVLPDMGGLDLSAGLRRAGTRAWIIFFGTDVSIHTAVEAMRTGALTVLEKPVDPDMLKATVFGALARPDRPSSSRAAPAYDKPPRPVADRWASYVWKACGSLTDLKTLGDWARFIGMSYSSLCETCRLLDIQPQEARDLTRVLRAVVQASLQDCRPEVLLDVGDRRTLNNLLRRSGLTRGAALSAVELLDRQTFIAADNEGLIALRALIERAVADR